jgi:hypothetical protein
VKRGKLEKRKTEPKHLKKAPHPVHRHSMHETGRREAVMASEYVTVAEMKCSCGYQENIPVDRRPR